MQLRNSTILVTGATGGIGNEVCRLLAAEGATLVMSCINAASLESLRKPSAENTPSGEHGPGRPGLN